MASFSCIFMSKRVESSIAMGRNTYIMPFLNCSICLEDLFLEEELSL